MQVVKVYLKVGGHLEQVVPKAKGRVEGKEAQRIIASATHTAKHTGRRAESHEVVAKVGGIHRTVGTAPVTSLYRRIVANVPAGSVVIVG